MWLLGKQALLLGGFYFVLSFFTSCVYGNLGAALDVLVFGTFVFFLIGVGVRKGWNWLTIFANKKPRLTNYLMALGVAEYFILLLVVLPSLIWRFNDVLAEDFEGGSSIYMSSICYVYMVVLLASLIWASYVSFFRKKA